MTSINYTIKNEYYEKDENNNWTYVAEVTKIKRLMKGAAMRSAHFGSFETTGKSVFYTNFCGTTADILADGGHQNTASEMSDDLQALISGETEKFW